MASLHDQERAATYDSIRAMKALIKALNNNAKLVNKIPLDFYKIKARQMVK